jgi:ankyrin repeat protein
MSSLEHFAKAIESGDSTSVQLLISTGQVDSNARLPRRYSPPALAAAAWRNDSTLVEILLRANARIDDIDDRESTACHEAAYFGAIEVLTLLLAALANLELRDRAGNTPIMLAIEKQNSQCVEMLLEAGAALPDDNDALVAAGALSVGVLRALLNRGVVVSELRQANGKRVHTVALGCHVRPTQSRASDDAGRRLRR